MKYQYILVSFFYIFGLLSCIHNESILPETVGYVYNKTTGKPEKDVVVTLYAAPPIGPEMPREFPLTDSLGRFYEPEYKELSLILIAMEGMNMSTSTNKPVILEKEGYLPDSIYLEYANITFVGNRSELIDTLYFSARIDPDYKPKEE